MSRARRRFAGAFVLIVALVALAIVFPRGRDARRPERPAPEAPRRGDAPATEGVPAPAATRTCVRVIDGDTVVLDGGERVRLIGVDTPELHREGTPVQYFAREAGAFTRRLVERRRVRLEYDRDREDRYGRTLAYVYLEDGTFVNLEIVRRGFGFAYTRFPFRHMNAFRAAERAARREGAGLWAEPDSLARPA